MDTATFISYYRKAFGEEELPLVFWYSDIPVNPAEKTGGCLFKRMKEVREGTAISLSADTIGCGGGKFYTGFTAMPDRIPKFVSEKERYKQTPEMVEDYIRRLHVPRTEKEYLNFARIDKIKDFDSAEGIFFLVRPDTLSGLVTWTYFDNNAEDAVTVPFGSGCSVIITQTLLENRKNGKRTFIGFFDPSVRLFFEPDILCYAIPMSRFREMCDTMLNSCLFDTPAWNKIRARRRSGKDND